jgi:hypothetical protein
MTAKICQQQQDRQNQLESQQQKRKKQLANGHRCQYQMPEMPETVWKPTTHEFSLKFSKNLSDRQKIHEKRQY